MAQSIMIQGTASDVGKSLICTALCRVFANDGYRVAPFKSQNMALNSYITEDGYEIGRAQGVQAEAARVKAITQMNPILLKPKQNMRSEIIFNGKRYVEMDAMDYRENFVEQVMPEVEKSLRYLQEHFDVVVLEGAGSPAEINLKARDIANMRMAHLADAPVILVADIDRGGVFATIVGTLALLDDGERARVKGIVINKFRGLKELLDDGLTWLEQETGIPVLGVIPYLDVPIEAEDSLVLSSLRLKQATKGELAIDVAFIRLPHLVNFTDMDPLLEEPGVGVRAVTTVAELGSPDLLILPSSKNIVHDLQWLKDTGLAQAIVQRATKIVGIGTGYYMLGATIMDKHALYKGLQLLPLQTTLLQQETKRQVAGSIIATKEQIVGYEMSAGEVSLLNGAIPFIQLADGHGNGAVTEDGHVLGTTLHHLLHNRHVTRRMMNEIRQVKGLPFINEQLQSDEELRDQAYELLAQHVGAHLNMEKIYEFMQMEERYADG